GGVVLPVVVEDVVPASEGRDDGEAAQVAGREGKGRLLAEEHGEPVLQFLVQGESAGKEPGPGARGAEVIEGGPGRLLQTRVLRQAQVVVGAGDDHLRAVHHDGAAALRGYGFEIRVHASRGGLICAAERERFGERVLSPLGRDGVRFGWRYLGQGFLQGGKRLSAWRDVGRPRTEAGASMNNPTAPPTHWARSSHPPRETPE